MFSRKSRSLMNQGEHWTGGPCEWVASQLEATWKSTCLYALRLRFFFLFLSLLQARPQKREWSLCTPSSTSPSPRWRALCTSQPSLNSMLWGSCTSTCPCTGTPTAGTCSLRWEELTSLSVSNTQLEFFLFFLFHGIIFFFKLFVESNHRRVKRKNIYFSQNIIVNILDYL